jgi:uncharacterized protein (DUF885 family)
VSAEPLDTPGFSGVRKGRDAATPLIQALVDDLVADDPVLGTQLGLTAHLSALPSWSPDAVRSRVAMLHRHETRLREAAASASQQDAVDVFLGRQIVRRCLRDLELSAAYRRRPSLYLDIAAGVYTLLARELAPPAERVQALKARLLATPGLLEEGRANLQPGLPRAAVQAALEYGAGLDELLGATVRGFAAEAGQAGALDEASAGAQRALRDFCAHLRAELLPGAVEQCAAGREVLLDIIGWEHVLPDTPEQLAAYGREVLTQTQAAMREQARDMGHENVAAALDAVRARHPSRDELVASYAQAVAAARAYIVDHGLVTVPAGEELRVIATPPFLRSVLPFAAYDAPGPFERQQVGFYYVTPPPDEAEGAALEQALRNHPWASLPTTGVHEAYPGHHLQLVRANLAPTLARRVAALPGGGALPVEGWAFYCEQMMREQGFLADPEVELMRLNDQLWRACRVVIDVELHLGVMDLAAAVDFLAATASMPRREAELECRRYAEEPGQAMAYLLGRREVLRLAATYREAHPQTPLAAFHDELLSWGSVAPAVIAWGMGLGPMPQAAASGA